MEIESLKKTQIEVKLEIKMLNQKQTNQPKPGVKHPENLGHDEKSKPKNNKIDA